MVYVSPQLKIKLLGAFLSFGLVVQNAWASSDGEWDGSSNSSEPLTVMIADQSKDATGCEADLVGAKLSPAKSIQAIVYSAFTYTLLQKLEERLQATVKSDFSMTVDQQLSRDEIESLSRIVYSSMKPLILDTYYPLDGVDHTNTNIDDLIQDFRNAPEAQVVQEISHLIYGLQQSGNYPKNSADIQMSYLNEIYIDRTMEWSKLAADLSIPTFIAGVSIGFIGVMTGDSYMRDSIDMLAGGFAITGVVAGLGGIFGALGGVSALAAEGVRVPIVRAYKKGVFKRQLARFQKVSQAGFESLPLVVEPSRWDLNPLLDSLAEKPLRQTIQSVGAGVSIII